MKKIVYFKLSLLIALLVLKNTSFSQTNEPHVLDIYRTSIDNIFSGIDSSKLSTGLLIQRAPAILDISKFNINNDSSSLCSVWNWLDLYNQLYLAHFSPADQKMKKSLIADYPLHIEQNAPVPLGIIFYDYNSINEHAVNNRYIVVDTINMIIRDISGPNIIPFDTVTCFAAAFLTDEEITTGLHSFYFNSNFLISNKTISFDSLYIDFDDGQGFIRIDSGEFFVNYLSQGEKSLKIRASYHGKEYIAGTSLHVADSYVMRDDNPPDFSPKSYLKAGIEAEYAIWYGCNSDKKNIRKPYLVVSGFDPQDKNRLEGSSGKKRVNLYQVSNKNGFLDRLRDDGFDIIIYRSNNSTESVINNAMNLVGFIQYINSIKTTNHELIIAGASMGGLVVRYALTYMEYNNIDHHTKLFISVDSPQEGATVPLGFQYLVNYLHQDLNGIITIVKDLKVAKEQMLDVIAAKEMLLYHYAGTQGLEANHAGARSTYLESLSNIGNFPKKCRSISISMGSGIGTGQGFAAGQSLLKKHPSTILGAIVGLPSITWEFEAWAVPNNIAKTIYKESLSFRVCIPMPWPIPDICMPSVTLASRNIAVNNTVSIDNTPGSKQGLHNTTLFIDEQWVVTLLEMMREISIEPNYDCFIPSYSALGLSFSNPHANIKNYLNNHNHVHKISNNMYMSLNNSSPSYFDFMYIENANDFHIYHPDTKEGVFSNSMLSTMTELSSPDNLYIDGMTVPYGKAISYSSRHNITVGYGVDALSAEHGNVTVQSGGNLGLYAGESISLEPGFYAQAGSNVEIAITNALYCPPGSFAAPIHSPVMTPEYTGDGEQDYKGKVQEASLFEIIKNCGDPVIFFPNPVQQQLMVSSNENTNHIYVYNLYGVLMHDMPFYRTVSLDMSSYASGIYIIKAVQENGNVVSGKIIKQ